MGIIVTINVDNGSWEDEYRIGTLEAPEGLNEEQVREELARLYDEYKESCDCPEDSQFIQLLVEKHGYMCFEETTIEIVLR